MHEDADYDGGLEEAEEEVVHDRRRDARRQTPDASLGGCCMFLQ
jgi:hypothetical protein